MKAKKNMKYQVKFYDEGGHSAGKEMLEKPGIVVDVNGSRYQEICDDSADRLRSPFGTRVERVD